MSETSKDYLSKYSGEQVEARLGRCNLVPTLDHVPGAEDLSFVDAEGTHTFLVGDECRYLDTEKERYVFYKLYDITEEGQAVWLLGGNTETGEVVTFHIATNQGLLDASFQDLWIDVWYDGLKVSCPFQGVPAELPLPAGKVCRVVPPEVKGYRTPEEQTFETVARAERTVVLQYSAERVMLSVSSSNETDCSEQVITVKAPPDTPALSPPVSASVPADRVGNLLPKGWPTIRHCSASSAQSAAKPKPLRYPGNTSHLIL